MKELEDYDWFPAILRRHQTDFIGAMVEWTGIYAPLVPVLAHMRQNFGTTRITDLCTGSSNPMFYLLGQLKQPTEVLLTDKFPFEPVRTAMGEHTIELERASYDVLEVSLAPNTIHTIFNAFHHFDEEEQALILEKLQATRAPFLIVEILQPNALEFVRIALTTTFGQWLAAPFVRPFSWLRLLFTYVLPINIVTVLTDGLVSVAKSKPLAHYETLVKHTQQHGYRLAVRTVHTTLGTQLTIIEGYPQV